MVSEKPNMVQLAVPQRTWQFVKYALAHHLLALFDYERGDSPSEDAALLQTTQDTLDLIPSPERLSFICNEAGDTSLLHTAIYWYRFAISRVLVEATPQGNDRYTLLNLEGEWGLTPARLALREKNEHDLDSETHQEYLKLFDWLKQQEAMNQPAKV